MPPPLLITDQLRRLFCCGSLLFIFNLSVGVDELLYAQIILNSVRTSEWLHLYCSYTFTHRLANVRCISNRKERQGNVTASKTSVADTLYDLLVRKGVTIFKHARSSFDSPYIFIFIYTMF